MREELGEILTGGGGGVMRGHGRGQEWPGCAELGHFTSIENILTRSKVRISWTGHLLCNIPFITLATC